MVRERGNSQWDKIMVVKVILRERRRAVRMDVYRL